MNILKKNTFFQNRDEWKPFSQKKMLLLHIFLCGFPLIPINRNTSILRKFKKAISKFKKKAITISSMKNLNFISTNSSLQLITIYSCYIYVIICFLVFLLKLSNIRLGIKPLFRQKPFFETFRKKSSMLVDCQTGSYKHCPFFVFLLKKFFEVCSFVAYSDVPQNKQIKHLRRRSVEQGTLLVNLIPAFPIIFPSRTLFDK